MTENPWVEWSGGECPVRPDAVVRVRFRGFLSENEGRAADEAWGRIDDEKFLTDIVAYRVVKP